MSKRQSVTKLADRTVGSPQLEEGAVTTEILDNAIVTDIDTALTDSATAISDAAAAASDAADAASDAATALSTANGKNTIYRQTSQPTGGTYADGDVWFDSDDDNKMYRYSSSPSPAWTSFTLGNNALSNLSANKITTGTLDANVVTVSNLSAGSITTGTLNGISITGVTIDIGGNDDSSFHVNTLGQIWSGSGSYSTAKFKVDNDGTIYASAGTIAGSIAMFANGNLTTSQGLGATTLGWNTLWSGQRSGIFSRASDLEFASLTYGDITIQSTTNRLTTLNSQGSRTNVSQFDFFTGIQSTDYHIGFNLRESGNRIYACVNDLASTLTFWFPGAYTPNFTSDRRLKSNIRSVSKESLDKFYSIPVHEWEWNENADKVPMLNFSKDNPTSIGVIADEIKQIYPYLVVDDDEEESTFATIAYGWLAPQMLCAILDLNTRITELEDKLSS